MRHSRHHTRALAGLCMWMMAAPSLADPPPRCFEAVRLTGEADAVTPVREALATGLLAELPATSCEGVEAQVDHPAGGRWHVHLTQGTREVEADAGDAAALASWIESWLAPSAIDEPRDPAPAPPAAPPAPAPTPRASTTELRTRRPETRTGPVVQAALRTGVDVDSVGPVWSDTEIAVAVSVSRHAWLGVGVAGALAPRWDDTIRRALRLSARGGWQTTPSWGALRLGAGIGIVSAGAERAMQDGSVSRDEESGPYLEAGALLDRRLAGAWSISTALLGRVHLPDFDDFGPDVIDQSSDPNAPEPLPPVAVTLQVGLAWNFGGKQ